MTRRTSFDRINEADISQTYPFPLRDDFLALFTLPRDMTEAEAERVAVYVKTLALPAPGGE